MVDFGENDMTMRARKSETC